MQCSGGAWSESAWTLPTAAPVAADVGQLLHVSAAGATDFPSGFYITGGAAGTDGLDTRAPATTTTTDATVTDVIVITPLADAVVRVVAHSLAHQPATGDTATRVRMATFKSNAGVVTQVGITQNGDNGNEQDAGAAAWNLLIVTDGAAIRVQVQGEVGKTIVWQPITQFERLAA